MLSIRPSTAADVPKFFAGKSPEFSFRGITVEEDGEPIAITGVYNYAGKRVVFSELTEAARKYRKSILRIAKDYLNSLKGELYAFRSETEPTADRFLEHLGFYPIGSSVYRRD